MNKVDTRIPPKLALSPQGDPEVQISCVSNIYVRMMHFKYEGDVECGHSHPFDHISMLSKGKIRITVGEHTKEFKAPQMIFIKKDAEHQLVALEDDTTVLCIHAIRDGDAVGDIIDPESTIIPPGAEGIDYLVDNKLLDFIVHDSKI